MPPRGFGLHYYPLGWDEDGQLYLGKLLNKDNGENDHLNLLNIGHVPTLPLSLPPDFKLPLSKPTATDNIMLGNHDQ